MRRRGGGGVRGRGALALNPLLPCGRSQAGLQTNKQTKTSGSGAGDLSPGSKSGQSQARRRDSRVGEQPLLAAFSFPNK